MTDKLTFKGSIMSGLMMVAFLLEDPREMARQVASIATVALKKIFEVAYRV